MVQSFIHGVLNGNKSFSIFSTGQCWSYDTVEEAFSKLESKGWEMCGVTKYKDENRFDAIYFKKLIWEEK